MTKKKEAPAPIVIIDELQGRATLEEKPAWTPAPPRSLEDGIKRYGKHPTTAQAKRLRKQLLKAYAKALELRGAVKSARLKKLAGYALEVPGLTVEGTAGKTLIKKTPAVKL